jgi:hypothetical protein
MDPAGFHGPAKQIRNYFTFNLRNVSRLLSLSARRATAANNIRTSSDVFNKHAVSLDDTVPVSNAI